MEDEQKLQQDISSDDSIEYLDEMIGGEIIKYDEKLKEMKKEKQSKQYEKIDQDDQLDDQMETQMTDNFEEDYFKERQIIPLEIETIYKTKPSQGYQRSQYFGSHIPFCFYKGQPLFTIGPDYSFFIGTFLFQSIIAFFLIKGTYGSEHYGLHSATQFICFFQLFIYFLTAALNPGLAPTPKTEGAIDEQHYCEICKVKRKTNRNHCYDCNICIDGHDHHCPWTSQCVGEGNLICFYMFLCSTVISTIFCYIIGITILTELSPNQNQDIANNSTNLIRMI